MAVSPPQPAAGGTNEALGEISLDELKEQRAPGETNSSGNVYPGRPAR